MAKARSTKSSSSRASGISVTKLYLLAVGCFVLSKLFVNKVDAVNYVLAALGFVLFALAFVKFFRKRKR